MDSQLILPTREIALDLLKILNVPYNVRRHSMRVADKAIEIALKIKKVPLNLDLIEIGAILHDIGRSQTHGFNHAILGGKILKERGFPQELVRICERHILGGLDKEDAREIGLPEKNYLPESIEEKIICLADKYMTGTKEVTIQERFQRWFFKYGKTNILLKSKKRIEEIEAEIKELM